MSARELCMCIRVREQCFPCVSNVLTPTMMMCIPQEYESKAAEARAKQAARRDVSPSICVCMFLSCLSDCVSYMQVHLYVSMCPCASVLA